MRGWRRTSIAAPTVAWAARPVVRDAMIAIGYSADVMAPDLVPVLGIFDIDGSPGFDVSHDLERLEAQTSEPSIDREGRARVAVWERGTDVFVVGAHRDGTELPRTTIPMQVDAVPRSVVTAIAGCDDGFVVSWIADLRDAAPRRFCGRFRDGLRVPEWSAAEFVVAATDHRVLCATGSNTGAEAYDRIVCRDAATGAVAWQRYAQNLIVAGATGDAFVLVHRMSYSADALVELVEAHATHAAALAAAGIAPDNINRNLEAHEELFRQRRKLAGDPTRERNTIELVDAATGRPRDVVEVAGAVVAVHASGTTIDAMVTDLETTNQLIDGVTGESTPFARRYKQYWRGEDPHNPLLVGRYEDRVVWIDHEQLHAGFTIPVPRTLDGRHADRRQRELSKANAVVAHGHVYARWNHELWILELD